MAGKSCSLVLVLDNSMFSEESDYDSNRLYQGQLVACEILSSFSKHFNTLKYTVIGLSLGGPSVFSIFANVQTTVSKIRDMASEKAKFPLLESLVLACKVLMTEEHSVKHIVTINCSPVFADSKQDACEVLEFLFSSKATFSVYSLCGEIFFLKDLCAKVGGSYYNCEKGKLMRPYFSDKNDSKVIVHGISPLQTRNTSILGSDSLIVSNVCFYYCPMCRNSVSSLPCICDICGLSLITMDHLEHHGQRPKATFQKLKIESLHKSLCFGCKVACNISQKCGVCSESYCADCAQEIFNCFEKTPCCLQMLSKES